MEGKDENKNQCDMQRCQGQWSKNKIPVFSDGDVMKLLLNTILKLDAIEALYEFHVKSKTILWPSSGAQHCNKKVPNQEGQLLNRAKPTALKNVCQGVLVCNAETVGHGMITPSNFQRPYCKT